jgi:hypothetical protein
MKSAAWFGAALAAGTVAAASLIVAPALAAQSLASRVGAVRTGTVLMSFAARPGVCGDGRGSVFTRRDDSADASTDGRWRCIPGPVRVAVGRANGDVVSVREWVGGRFDAGPSDTNLGTVSAPEAARYLLGVARGGAGRSASEAIAAASFADSVDIAPELSALVRDDNVSVASRKQALFWLGQGDAPTSALIALDGVVRSTDLREQFVFVLSQRRDDAALDKLIDVARHDPDHEIRKRAMFWLGQSRSPKAIKFFRDILTG